LDRGARPFNAPDAGAALDPVREIFDEPEPGRGLALFADQLGAPRILSELGLKESDLERAADLAMQTPFWNPRPLVRDEILALLRSAWTGEVG